MIGLVQPSRRSFIAGLAALVVAPSIVRASSLMPVHSFRDTITEQLNRLAVGDVITIEGVEGWNTWLQEPTGRLRQFVITGVSGERGLSVYPVVEDSHRYRNVVRGPKPFAQVHKEVKPDPRGFMRQDVTEYCRQMNERGVV